MKDEEFELEGQLRARRAEPRAEFAKTLARTVGDTGRRSPRRLGSALALAGLIVVAIASFGGIGYASSSSTGAKNQPSKVWIIKRPSSSAAAQYQTTSTTGRHAVTPKNANTPGGNAVQQVQSAQGTLAAPAAKTAQLPFTGLSLWVPLAIGLMLISLGLLLRTRGRRRNSAG